MPEVKLEVDRVLLLLRNKVRERGFTQLEVQNSLGWGRSYMSQLLTKQKALRLEQVLLILGVVGVDPAKFFDELYPGSGNGCTSRIPSQVPDGHVPAYDDSRPGLSRSVTELRSMVRELVDLLVDRDVIGVDDLTVAVRAVDQRGVDGRRRFTDLMR